MPRKRDNKKRNAKSETPKRDKDHSDYTQIVRVPDDPNNTVLVIHKDADPQEAISKFLRKRGAYLRDKLQAAIQPIVEPETR